MTSSTTLNESISDSKAKKVHFQSDLTIEGDNEKRWYTLKGRPAVPDYTFNILFLGGAGAGKSKIIDRVSRASPRPKSPLMPNRLSTETITTITLLQVMMCITNPSEPPTSSAGWALSTLAVKSP
jgi:hypothetical protein